MKWWKMIDDMPARTRRGLAAALALLLTIAAAWGVHEAINGGADERRGQARPSVVEGMQDMAGMEGMTLGGSSSVQLTADQIRQFGVTFDYVEQRRLQDEIRTVGIVNFDETRMAGVTPKFSGYVERLYVDFTGRPVRRGEALLDIYSPELVAAQEELLLAIRLEGALGESAVPGMPAGTANLVRAARQRLRLWDISEAQIEEILKSGRARRTLTLHAPVSGIVVEKNVLAGQAVQAGQPLFTIADLSEVWVEAELREMDAGLVREGDPATVELSAAPGRLLRGRVEYVYPTLQQQARTLKARIAIPNPDGRLKPGMFATVRVSAPGRLALTVPLAAVVRTGERQIVFVEMGPGRILPQEVEIGRVAGGQAEVLSGLEPGQRVVTSAQFLLDSESNLAEVMKAMMSQMNMSDMRDMQGMDMGGMEMPGADMKGVPMPKRER
ncbi:MAG TPA: efflux RND transporter periplasmic adaptor subunit [Longimicrobiales bacterium]|nr:efflux RND transporter periplasmic adaptor subunit [Longimicrobiales bacterium]